MDYGFKKHIQLAILTLPTANTTPANTPNPTQLPSGATPPTHPTFKSGHLLIDPTENTVRYIPEDAITRQTNQQIVIQKDQTTTIATDYSQSKDTEEGSIRLVLSQNAHGQPLNIIAHAMGGSTALSGYEQVLDKFRPRTMLDTASNPDNAPITRRNALIDLFQNFPYFIGERGFYLPAQYEIVMHELLKTASTHHLPAIGLFVNRVLTINSPHQTLDTQATRKLFIKKAALLPDSAWSAQKHLYGHLMFKEDKIDIVTLRKKYAELNRQKREQMQDKAKQQTHRAISDCKPKLEEELNQQFKAKQEKEAPDTPLPGSSARARVRNGVTNLKAQAANKQFTNTDDNPANTPHTATVASSYTPIHPTLALTPQAARQHANYLVSQISPSNALDTLQQIAALWRTFIHDAKPIPQLREQTWQTLNTALAQALQGKDIGIQLPDPNMPLGDMQPLLQVPPEKVLDIIKTIPNQKNTQPLLPNPAI